MAESAITNSSAQGARRRSRSRQVRHEVPRPMLKLGDSGETVKVLQGSLNKFGAILLLDGDFGPMTCDAILETRAVLQQPPSADADDEFQQAIARHPDPFPPLTAAGVTFIARRSEEHTSELQSLAYLVCRLLLDKKNRNNTRL